jgi:hypothetical protein
MKESPHPKSNSIPNHDTNSNSNPNPTRYNLIESLPLEVNIPKSLWTALSYAVTANSSESTQQLHAPKGLSKEKIELIIGLGLGLSLTSNPDI